LIQIELNNGNMKKNKSLPQTGQVDIVSPATRLLEKRR
jgi:hypothetical protein